MTGRAKQNALDSLLTKPEAQQRLAELEEKVLNVQETFALWRQSGIPERTIVILLAHATKISQRDIKTVLEGLETLYDEYFTEEEP